MKVLVACEFSAVVQEAFRFTGHNAISIDIEPTEGLPEYHIQDDVLNHLDEGWDLMIAHPPCTYLANSGSRWLYDSNGDRDPERWKSLNQAIAFFKALQSAPIPKIAIENPVMHMHAYKHIGSYTQKIQPYEYGHNETKGTCLWLKNLPHLNPTSIITERHIARVHTAYPGPDRQKERDRTLPGIAVAMALQWGNP